MLTVNCATCAIFKNILNKDNYSLNKSSLTKSVVKWVFLPHRTNSTRFQIKKTIVRNSDLQNPL